MKFSTRARYGLRIMVELARLQQTEPLVQLKRIAKITGLSIKYLGQLAIALRDNGLIVGVSGKNGGYMLSRAPENITLRQIIAASQGPIFATDCVVNPGLCMNAEGCETRTIWALVTQKMQEVLDEFTLAELIDKSWMERIKAENPHNPYLFIEHMIRQSGDQHVNVCTEAKTDNSVEHSDRRS